MKSCKVIMALYLSLLFLVFAQGKHEESTKREWNLHHSNKPSSISVERATSTTSTFTTKQQQQPTKNTQQRDVDFGLIHHSKVLESRQQQSMNSIAKKNIRQQPRNRKQMLRHLQGGGAENYFQDMNVESLEEGFAMGASLLLLISLLCLICCCCSMCCGGGRRGGGGCSLMDILAMFCCYEMFCDDTPGVCFVPMGDGDMLC